MWLWRWIVGLFKHPASGPVPIAGPGTVRAAMPVATTLAQTLLLGAVGRGGTRPAAPSGTPTGGTPSLSKVEQRRLRLPEVA